MLQDFGSLHHFDQRVGLHDTGVGDDDIEVVDPVLLPELLHDVEGVLLDRRVVLDDDQTAPLALGQVGQRLGGRVPRVTIGGDDSLLEDLVVTRHHSTHGSDGKKTYVLRLRKEALDEPLAQTTVPTRHQNEGWRHLCVRRWRECW
jgi:hypothetical protein